MSEHESAQDRERADAGSYDYIIVGAGSAGCVLASRLTEDSHSVLLLEAGGPDTDQRIHIPREFEELQGTDMDWQYVTEPEPGLNNRQIPWPRGKVLGGSSSINALVYMRGNPRDYDGWAEMGNAGWSYKEVLPYFIKSEANTRPHISKVHGRGGPVTVSDVDPPNPASEAFLAAAIEVGEGVTDDLNDGEQLGGASLLQVTIKDGRRSSAATGYLTDEVKRRRNLKIATHAQATRVVIKSGKVVGVEYSDHTTPGHPIAKVARAKREVILCGGTVNSPQLLMLSGIGPEDDLRKLGIKMVINLPGVGRNLQDHPIAAVLYLYKKGLSAPGAAGGVEGGLFIRTRKGLETPDVQFHFTHKILGRPPAPPADAGYMIVATLVKPLSRGFLKLRSKNPDDKPEIHANYLHREEDVKSLVEGIKRGRKIGEASAFDSFRGPEAVPGPDVRTDEQLAAKIRETAGGLFHPVGTCKMGTDPRDGAVVDAELRVYGVKGLRVVDASIMPVITTGNTNAPTIMIAEKASDMIRQDSQTDGGYNVDTKDRSLLGILDRIAESIESRNSGELPSEVRSDPREEVLLRWAIGRGTLRADKKGVTFIEDVYKLNGQPDGHMVVSSETIAEGPAELIAQPPNPEVIPADPNRVEHLPTKSFGKVKWTRPDGSTLTALGVGNSNIVPLTGDDFLTAEVLAMVITNGTGFYEGAHGLWTSNHSILNPPGGTLLGSKGEFIRKQLHTIRVIRGINVAPPAPAPHERGGSGAKGGGRPQSEKRSRQ